MTTDDLRQICAPSSATILQALQSIDSGGAGICCVLDQDDRLVAVLSDGDVRRALLSGASLAEPALDHAESRPRTVTSGTSRAHVLDLMRSIRIDAVPEVDGDGRLAAIHTLSDILGGPVLPNRAVIMAGGKGTRLGDLTKDTPKPLMTVAGRPIIEWIILGLVGSGIRHVSVSVNHMAQKIIERLGDGRALGCSIDYLQESPDQPLGTAGSLTLLPAEATSDEAEALIVLNGDLMVDFDARDLLRHHKSHGSVMTMGTKVYQHAVPYGVVEVNSERELTSIVEKPNMAVEVNAAIYCIDANLVRRLPAGEPSTMPELVQLCLDAGETVTAWSVSSDWIDVGTPADLARAKGER